MKIFRNLASEWLPAALVTVPAAQVRPLSAAALPRVYHAPTQAEPALAPIPGTTGFAGMCIQVSAKRSDVRGVPPRGRPV